MRHQLRVLDSYSLIAYLEGEAGSKKMIEIIKSARDSWQDLLMSVVNWGEVFYITMRESGREKAVETAHLVSTLPIEIIDADMELTRLAAEIKSEGKMSYADCFAAALARQRKAELVTGDAEFKEIEDVIKIFWID